MKNIAHGNEVPVYPSREYRFTCVCSLRTSLAPQSLAWCHVSQILREGFRIVDGQVWGAIGSCVSWWESLQSRCRSAHWQTPQAKCLCEESLDFTKTVNWLLKVFTTILLFVLLITEKQASPFLNKKFLFLALSPSYILSLSVTFSLWPWNVTRLARKPLSICRLDGNLCPYSVTVTKYLWMDSL